MFIRNRVQPWVCVLIGLAATVWESSFVIAQDDLRQKAAEAQAKAVKFFQEKVAVEGGYVYQVSSDLKYREGEGDAGKTSVWVQPPGTPAVGMAYIEAYERTGDEYLLKAAIDTARCLLRGQLHSGGWQNHIDFDEELRGKLAYRVDGPPRKKARNISSFDDDQTQSAIRFLVKVDRALKFKDPAIHEAVEYAIAAVLRNQLPAGGWAQVFEAEPDKTKQYPVRNANYPETWPREYPGGDYWWFYTLNDQALVRVMQTMWDAGEVYQRKDCRDAALKAAEFLLRAQMPDPQPAWAQQYNYEMQPIWARKFEPPAVSGGESQVVIGALMDLAQATGDTQYLAPIPKAIAYLEKSVLPDGRMARFYELKTNKPLYFTRDYKLTYDDSDMPTHYGFKLENGVPKLKERFEKLKSMSSAELIASGNKEREQRAKSAPRDEIVRKIIAAMDDRGAWVKSGKLKYIKAKDVPVDQQLILSTTFADNLDQLSRYLAKQKK